MAEESHRIGLCESCREIKDITYTDPIGREYCAGCFATMPVATPERMVAYLMATIPFKVGDRVEARTAGVLYDGIGVIDEVSIDIEKFGTPVHPSFHVVFAEKAYDSLPDSVWYMERQLVAVSDE
jgi:hypothetical protein